MRTFSDLQKNNSFRFSSVAVESLGDESLISDSRSRVTSTELVERKLQIALQGNRIQVSPLESAPAN